MPRTVKEIKDAGGNELCYNIAVKCRGGFLTLDIIFAANSTE